MESSNAVETEAMRHVIYDRFGERDVLQVVESPLPEPGEGEVLIRIHGAGLNPIDWKTRKGLGFAARQIENRLPWTPGYDAAGEVIAALSLIAERFVNCLGQELGLEHVHHVVAAGDAKNARPRLRLYEARRGSVEHGL